MSSSSDVSDRIKECMKQVIKNYDSLRGKSVCKEEDFWNVVVISAADDEQREAFELQINHKKAAQELPLNIPFFIISDPPGVQIGNGGSTLHVLQILHKELGSELFSKRILLIHAGGLSKRLPTASVLGKIFTPLPFGKPTYQMFDLKLALYLPFAKQMRPGICVVCSDDIETYFLQDINQVSKDWAPDLFGFFALGHKGDVEIGENHGVYILEALDKDTKMDASFHSCLQVLQKPTRQVMVEKGAIIEGFGICTDSIFYFSHQITQTLLEFYPKIKPLTCEIDAYRDFLQALGTSSNKNYITSEDEEQRRIQVQLFDLLHHFPLQILVLHESQFYHLGTCLEYINNLTFRGSSLFVDLNMVPVISSKILNAKSEEEFAMTYPSTTIMHSIISSTSTFQGPSVVEYCEIISSIDVGEYCILSNCYCSCKERLIIPSFTLLHTIPIKIDHSQLYVTIAFGIHDNVKNSVSFSEIECLTYFGKPVKDLVILFGCTHPHELFSDEVKSFSLWNMKLFEVTQNANDSFLSTLNLVTALKNGENKIVIGEITPSKLSMVDIIKYKDTLRVLKYREELNIKIQDS